MLSRHTNYGPLLCIFKHSLHATSTTYVATSNSSRASRCSSTASHHLTPRNRSSNIDSSLRLGFRLGLALPLLRFRQCAHLEFRVLLSQRPFNFAKELGLRNDFAGLIRLDLLRFDVAHGGQLFLAHFCLHPLLLQYLSKLHSHRCVLEAFLAQVVVFP